MTHAIPLPAEHYRLFLAVRRGVPLAGTGLLLVLAALVPSGRGWFLLGAVFLLAEVWPTFRHGSRFLATRRAITLRDAHWAKGLLPVARFLGQEETWILSFCGWNNHRVRESFARHRARRALILLPHCIQMARCKADVLKDLSTCYECGHCAVGDLLPMQLERGWDSRITNRSHKAVREAREFKPDLVVAVSCADRLLKGLMKVPEIPSYAIPLGLPHGMCVDTTFSVEHLFAAMDTLVEPRESRRERQDSDKVRPLHREGIA
jgi:hypothetical protein